MEIHRSWEDTHSANPTHLCKGQDEMSWIFHSLFHNFYLSTFPKHTFLILVQWLKIVFKIQVIKGNAGLKKKKKEKDELIKRS